ncbi:MAG: hypothetical protein J7L11_10195 [Thermoprotei archaeon]|nr:hypothetical protein [Thermoprotei archaeon]
MRQRPKVLLIAHTHWDREWYLTFERFRYRLVQCIDRALGIFDKDPRYHSFMLDGQTIVLEDYLEVKPYMKEVLEKRVREGKLIVGPLYVQPDEWLVSGEGLIRNLLLGIRIAKSFGRVMKVGYLPDTFGHTIQLPQILRGFDIDTFVFSRGMGSELKSLGTPFIWRAPDGSEVLALFLLDGYCNCERLPKDPERAIEYLSKFFKRWRPICKVPLLPGMVGCDHQFPKEWIPDVVKEAKGRQDLPFEVIQGNLEELLNEAKKYANKLGVYSGEMLSSYYRRTLYGCWSSRVYLKQLNFENEVLLVNYVEPLWTIAWLLGNEYPKEFIWQAWRYVLQCHAHDSICGCSIDEVHKECEVRQLKARNLAWGLLAPAAPIIEIPLAFLWHECDRAKFAMPFLTSKLNLNFSKNALLYLVAFNTLAWNQKAPIKLRLRFDYPVRIDVRSLQLLKSVLPSAYYEHLKRIVERTGVFDLSKIKIKVRDADGRVIPHQVTRTLDGAFMLELVDSLPAMGYKAYAIEIGESEDTPEFVKVERNSMENEFLKVTFYPEKGGAFKILDKRSSSEYPLMNFFEDDGDAGDEYDYSPPKENLVLSSKDVEARLEFTKRGPIVAEAKVRLTMRVPKSLKSDRSGRSNELVKLPIVMFVTLYAGIPRVDVRVLIENRAEDHRLRVVFPTGMHTAKHHAETHFYVIERDNMPKEQYVPTYPMRTWVDVNDGEKGLCIATKGLHEYEIRRGENGSEIIVTLMRCVGWLSRPAFLTRPDSTDPPMPTPEAQCKRLMEFEYSIMPHRGEWLEARVYKTAREFIAKPLVQEDLPHEGDLPNEFSFLKVNPEEVVLTCMKKAEDDDYAVIRLLNVSNKRVVASLEFFRSLKEAWRANLNEEPLERLNITGRTVQIDIEPYRLETLKVRL